MIGYLLHYQHPSLEEIADEMLAILSDRNRIMQKKDLEKVIDQEKNLELKEALQELDEFLCQ